MTHLSHPNHRLTSSGFYVCGVKRGEHTWRDGKTGQLKTIKYFSGRITENEKGDTLHPAEWAKWHLDGRAIKHEFGDLILGSEQ